MTASPATPSGARRLGRYGKVLLVTFTQLLYVLPYLDQTFFVQFRAEYGLNNEQSGTLIGFYTMTTLPAYLIGGWLADRFSAKWLLVASCACGGGIGLLISRATSYDELVRLYLAYGLTTSALNWSAMFKMIRGLAGDGEQGRMFTFSDAAYALISAAVQYGALKLMLDAGMSMRHTFAIVAGVLLAAGVALVVFLRDPAAASDVASDSVSSGSAAADASPPPSWLLFGAALRHPATWIMGVMWMCGYVAVTTLTYANPYLSQVLLMSVGMGTALEVFRTTVLKVVLSPLGGWWRDKLGRSPPILFSAFGGVAVLAVVLALAATGTPPVALVIALVAAMAVLMALATGSLYAMMAEARVPVAMVGTVWGLTSIIGYSTDIWLPAMVGRWIDRLGPSAYPWIFLLVAAAATLGLINTWVYRQYLLGRWFAGRAVLPPVTHSTTSTTPKELSS